MTNMFDKRGARPLEKARGIVKAAADGARTLGEVGIDRRYVTADESVPVE